MLEVRQFIIKVGVIRLIFPILVNCDSTLTDSKVGIDIAIIQSACWDVGEALEEMKHVSFNKTCLLQICFIQNLTQQLLIILAYYKRLSTIFIVVILF